MRIERDDVTRPEVLALLAEHVRSMHEISPPGFVFVYDASQLQAPDVTFWTIWDGDVLLGCGALKELTATTGEVKSMRTSTAQRRRGAGRAMLDHLVAIARERQYEMLCLETGAQAEFAPAHRLYESAGFERCGAFGSYPENDTSVFMRLRLRDQPQAAPPAARPPEAP